MDSERLAAIFAAAELGSEAEVAFLLRGDELLAQTGSVAPSHLAHLVVEARRSWPESEVTGQLYFVDLPDHEGTLLLYSRPVGPDCLLTLAGHTESGLAQLREEADRLAAAITLEAEAAEPSDSEAATLIQAPEESQDGGRATYAVVWRPRKAIPSALHTPLRQAVQRIAHANACTIRYLSVRPEYIQLVVTCPPGHSSAWAAHLFKNGTEADIQRQFNTQAALWVSGYYAVETEEPLDAGELALFLS